MLFISNLLPHIFDSEKVGLRRVLVFLDYIDFKEHIDYCVVCLLVCPDNFPQAPVKVRKGRKEPYIYNKFLRGFGI